MEQNITFLFNKDLRVTNILSLIFKNPRDQELFKKIKSNFFVENELIIKGLTIQNAYKGKFISYDELKGGFIVTRAGFVELVGSIIKVLSPVFVNKTRTIAYFVLPPVKEKLSVINVDEIIKILKENGIKYGIDTKAIRKALSVARNGYGIIFKAATGKLPVNGSVYKVELDMALKGSIGKVKPDGTIDFKEKDLVKNIKKGTIIGTYKPSITPEDGIDVFGNEIKAEMDHSYTYKISKDFEIDDNNNIIASKNGILVIDEDNRLNISDFFIIPGDVSISTGNINSDVSVQIKGRVQEGFSVKSGKDLIIDESIIKANVEAGKNLTVRRGIIGEGNKYLIHSNGNISAEYFEHANIYCLGDIKFTRSIVHSNVMCAGKIKSVNKKGTIIGGTVVATEGIEIGNAGSRLGVETTLVAGVYLKDKALFDKLNTQLKEYSKKSEEYKAKIGQQFFNSPEEYLNSLDPDKKEKVLELIDNYNYYLKLTEELRNKIDELKRKKFNKEAIITIYNDCFEGVIIQFGEVKHYVTKKLTGVKFFWNDELKKVDYKFLY